MNKTILIGRVARDIELRQTTSGKSVVTFPLAVNRDFKNSEGNYDADFITCVAFGNQADTISRYVRKGDRFGITGKIQTRNYDKNGSRVYVTEIIVESFEFLESKKSETPSLNVYPDIDEIGSDDDLPFN